MNKKPGGEISIQACYMANGKKSATSQWADALEESGLPASH